VKAFAKMVVFCPLKKEEVNARKCKGCKWFGGLGLTADQMVFIECKYEEGRGESDAIPGPQDE